MQMELSLVQDGPAAELLGKTLLHKLSLIPAQAEVRFWVVEAPQMVEAAAVVLAGLELEQAQLAMLVLVDLEFLIRFQEPQLIMAAVAEPLFMERMQTGPELAV
jgi:hypothetical protein